MSALIELSELFFPNRCLLCGKRASGVLCCGCRPSLPAARERCLICHAPYQSSQNEMFCPLCKAFPSPARYLRYIWEYEGLYRELIHTIKYKPSKRLATALGRTIAPMVKSLFPIHDWDLIAPIPSSNTALLKRGFNQCLVFATQISKEIDVPWSVFALSHLGYRKRQAEVPHDRRFANIKNVLRGSSAQVKNRTILIIDDVLTTGATISVACQELLKAGAAAVDVLTVARAGNWHTSRAEVHAKLYSRAHGKTR